MHPPAKPVIAITAALGFWCAPAPAQNEEGRPLVRAFSRRAYESTESGAGPQNFAAVQDRRGVLYFGNNLGILEFDGVSWRMIPTPTIGVVLSLAVDEKGEVFAGLSDDIGHLVPNVSGELGFVSLAAKVPKGAPRVSDVWQTFATMNGVYFRSEKAIYRLAGGAITVLLPPATIFSIGEVVRGVLYERVPKYAVVRVEGDALVTIPEGEALANEKIFFYLPVEDTKILLGARSGFLLYDVSPPAGQPHVTRFPLENEAYVLESQPYCGVALRDGRFALGTLRHGILVIDRQGRLVRRVDKASGLADDSVLYLNRDRDGGLWAGLNNGVSRVEMPAPITHFDDRDGLDGFVESIVRFQGTLFVTAGGGVKKLVPGRGVEPARFEAVAGITLNGYKLRVVAGRLLAGTNDGLFDVEDGKVTSLRPETTNSLASSERHPRRVFAGWGSGVLSYRREGERWVGEGSVKGIDDEVVEMEEAADGTLWAGTESRGIWRVRFEPDDASGARGAASATHFGPESGIPAGFCYPMRIGEETLFATKKGLLRFDGARFTPDARLGAMLSDGSHDLVRIAEDGAGGVFVRGSGYLIYERRRPDGTWGIERHPIERIPRSIDVHAFLVEREPGGRTVTWVGTREGLFRIDGALVDPRREEFNVLVRRVSSGDRRLFGGFLTSSKTPELPFGKTTLRFSYAATAFEDGSQTRYETWLEPFEKSWSAPTEETHRDFTNLSEGAYVFHARARDLLDRTSREASYALRVLPPWYRSAPAWALWALLAVGLVYGIAQARVAGLRRQADDLERRVADRTYELHEANQKLEEAQEKIAHLVETAGEAQENVSRWAQKIGSEIARTIGVEKISAFAIDRDHVRPLTDPDVPAPSLSDLQPIEGLPFSSERIVRVTGASGELVGALVVKGPARPWDEAQRRLVDGFARQLGGALEMRRMRERVAAAESARAALRADMERRGVPIMRVCSHCRRCFGSDVELCPEDGRLLDASRLLPYRLLGRYRLDRILGEGGMGTVFVSLDEKLGREVAIKVVRPELFDDPGVKARFDREARAVARVKHPGVVAIFDSGNLEDGSAFLVMERLTGKDLASVLLRHGRGTPSQIAELVRQAGAALSAAHRAGVVHRDVKPENIFLSRTAGRLTVKIVDFGLAKAEGAGEGLTRTGMVAGTPWYMSPEQVAGADVNGRSDLYSLAASAYEALVGRRIVPGRNVAQVFDRIVRESPAPPSTLRASLSSDVDALFERALAKDPSQRPASAEDWGSELARSLEAIADGELGWPEKLDSRHGAGAMETPTLNAPIS